MINGIKPNPMVGDFDRAMDRLVENIHKDYDGWRYQAKYSGGRGDTKANIIVKPGRKFIKIIRDNSVWGFVAKADGVHKGVPMIAGDVLKSAGWSAPAKHTRGNIFDNKQDYFSWTGPDYR